MADACTNCFRALPLPRPRFCPHCGQETNLRPPKMSEFVQQLGGAYFSTEGALWRTLALLVAKPGELTRRYLAGQRKHYVLPLRLYLTISVLVLLAMRLVATINVETPAVKLDGGESRNFAFTFGLSRAGMQDGKFFCENLPPWVCKRVQRRLDIAPERFSVQVEEFFARLISNVGIGMFVLLPLFALWQKIVYWNRRLYFTEHLVFALHLHAFWFLALAMMLPGIDALVVVAMLAIPVYGLLALKRVYGGRWWPLLLRAAFVSVLYLVTLGFVIVGLLMLTVIV